MSSEYLHDGLRSSSHSASATRSLFGLFRPSPISSKSIPSNSKSRHTSNYYGRSYYLEHPSHIFHLTLKEDTIISERFGNTGLPSCESRKIQSQKSNISLHNYRKTQIPIAFVFLSLRTIEFQVGLAEKVYKQKDSPIRGYYLTSTEHLLTAIR
jgi:hypothetical protein